jgi:hypothetical protein
MGTVRVELRGGRIKGPKARADRLPLIAWSMLGVASVVVIAVAAPYFANFHGPWSADAEDWARFGTYFGGVAGPFLALISVVGLVLTLLLQNRQIVEGEKKALAELHVRSLGELTRDLETIEGKEIGHGATVGEILDEPSKLNAGLDGKAFTRWLRQFAELLQSYSATVAMYRDNVQPYWDVKTFEARGLRNLERLRPHLQLLGPLAPVGAHIIEGHLKDTLPLSDEDETSA